MKDAKNRAVKLVAAGVMVWARALPRSRTGIPPTKVAWMMPPEHKGALIDGTWATTDQRRAPERKGIVLCPDGADRLIAEGWSVEAVQACLHGWGPTNDPHPTFRQRTQATTAQAQRIREAHEQTMAKVLAHGVKLPR